MDPVLFSMLGLSLGGAVLGVFAVIDVRRYRRDDARARRAKAAWDASHPAE